MVKQMIKYLLLFPLFLSAALYKSPPPEFKPAIEVAALYTMHEGKVLLLHRQDAKSEGNCWGAPAGKVKRGETPLQAVVRETLEETGQEFSPDSIEFIETVYAELDGGLHVVLHIFSAAWPNDPTNVKINFHEHKGFTWVTNQQSRDLRLMQDEDLCLNIVFENRSK